MLAVAAWPLQWARSLGHRFFLQFGLHCATHQIRVILISCVVITSLFYPALDVYTSSRTSSQTIIDGLVSQGTPSTVHSANDLVNIWAADDSLFLHDDPMTRARCQNGNALRVERVLVQSSRPAEGDNILLSTLELEKRIHTTLRRPDNHLSCLKKPNGQCFVVSPLAFWEYDEDALSADESIIDTLSSSNISIHGIPITPHMVLAGRGSYEPNPIGLANSPLQTPVTAEKFDYATYLVLTYFFPQTTCWGSEGEHAEWRLVVKSAVGDNGEVDHQRRPESTLIALEYDPHRDSTTQSISAISAFVWFAYICFFAYVAWSVRRMDAMHSRLGVTFTALVEISVSTITSLSVCALVGFKITMVPWEVLPIVIVFVGAENMFNLVDAVGKTSVTLSVKQRIAEGLSRAGTSNTLKVVSYNAILGVIAAFSEGAVRQFCAFAIVVLVAHWFLAHTFFMAVLSIDLARLELEELLRHDTSLAPSVPTLTLQNKKDVRATKKATSTSQKIVFTIKNLLRGRATTNISLLMLLAIAATLYYTTYTSSNVGPQLLTTTPTPKPPGAIARKPADGGSTILSSAATAPPPFSTSSPQWSSGSTAEQIWNLLNPGQTPLLHLRLELPTIVSLRPLSGQIGSNGGSAMKVTAGSKFTMKTARIVLWLLSIMLFPIAATTGALYGLLLYLLRNTELLEAQRHRLGADEEVEDRDQLSGFAANDDVKAKKTLEGDVAFHTLPRAFSSDVEMVASSANGKVVVSVGLRNEIAVWISDSGKTKCIATLDGCEELMKMMGAGLGNGVALGMMAGASSSAASSNPMLTISCVAMDEEGTCFSVGTAVGMVAAWKISKESAENKPGDKLGDLRLKRLPILVPEGSPATVRNIKFVLPTKSKFAGRVAPPNGLASEPSSPESKGKGKSSNGSASNFITLLTTDETGTVVKWSIPTPSNLGTRPSMTFITSSRSATPVRSLLITLNNRVLVAFCLDDGTLDIVDGQTGTPTTLDESILQAGSPYDVVWKVQACRAEIGGSERLVVVAATESGVVSLWDGRTGECISILDESAHGRVNHLRVSPVHCEKCHFCGQMPMESLTVAFSVDHVVRFEKLYVDDTAYPTSLAVRRCSCSRASAQLLKGQVLSRVSSRESLLFGGGKRSRSNSGTTTTSQGSSPRIPRARLATAFETNTAAAFPVSGHGVHSRRASEKEKESGGRRSSELLTVPLLFPPNGLVGHIDEYDGSANGDGAAGSITPTMASQQAPSIWRTSTVVPLLDMTCERGGWDVSGDVYVGVRRKSRPQTKSKAAMVSAPALTALHQGSTEDGLTGATLERWEVWSFDPALVSTRSSLLVSLASRPELDEQSTSAATLSKPSTSHKRPHSLSSSRTHSSSSSFSSSISSSSNEQGESIPRLPFTRVSPTLITPSHAVAGFGNTIGIFHFAS
ncbi:sterol-sensing domain of SREBP cleavage-activation-domain-containing protein [Crepidotus variabilis]|uniref:Sterol regulatory element-binding protein cleavage-activating protein n=1 Tax=Crepidotus variabilis TaxID=179855 RepID=A0A9P6EPG7_9AGAR|nr:sterol-sensing domain of SREBP cleavage-activation-domain-containing protein [Crepidotus variabilis]